MGSVASRSTATSISSFLRLALGARAACRELAHDRRPGFFRRAVPAHLHAADLQVLREHQVGVAIADHGAAGDVHVLCADVLVDQQRLRLAARTVVFREVRADEHGVELDALRAEGVHHQLMGAVEVRLREARGAEAVLVR